MQFKEMLVVIPHSGILVPSEIPLDSLSEDFPQMMRNVDWYTNWLYDFRGVLHNSQLVFPYCSLILEANRHPEMLDESVPLIDALKKPIYKAGLEPDIRLRRSLSKRYLNSFHREIKREISGGKIFILDAHSTVTARGVTDSQIELMNFQNSSKDVKPKYFCPEAIIETYANELIKRLCGVKVTVNQSRYDKIYGHVCGEHSIHSLNRVGNRVPAILQEVNQKLYMNSNGTPNLEALETLRRACAEALYKMSKKIFGNS